MLSNFSKKTYEICYAVFRLSDTIKNSDLKNRLEKAGLDILEAGSLNNNSSLNSSLSHLEALVLFSQGIGEIGYLQAQVLLREIGNLNSAIRQTNTAITELDLEELFQTPVAVSPDNASDDPSKQESLMVVEKEKENTAIGNFPEKSGEARQSAIMEIMRQVQNCRIKDLIAAFPGVSERTLRYDLQKLCEDGVIERQGTGGPGTYYQVKSLASPDLAKRDSVTSN